MNLKWKIIFGALTKFSFFILLPTFQNLSPLTSFATFLYRVYIHSSPKLLSQNWNNWQLNSPKRYILILGKPILYLCTMHTCSCITIGGLSVRLITSHHAHTHKIVLFYLFHREGTISRNMHIIGKLYVFVSDLFWKYVEYVFMARSLCYVWPIFSLYKSTYLSSFFYNSDDYLYIVVHLKYLCTPYEFA